MTDGARERGVPDGTTLDAPRLDDPAQTETEITGFVREVVSGAGADGVVVTLDGGIASTVAATLAAEALGSASVHGLVLPTGADPDGKVYDAYRVAEELVIDYHAVGIQPLLDRVVRTLAGEARGEERGPADPPVPGVASTPDARGNDDGAVGNAAARLRMLIAYFEANAAGRLVLGTLNRTELLLGRFTKHGDAGADLLPLGDLYGTEVRTLARHLDVREAIVGERPAVDLPAGRADEPDLEVSLRTVDTILHHLLDRDREPRAVADGVGADRDLVRACADLIDRTARERIPPPTPSDRPHADPR